MSINNLHVNLITAYLKETYKDKVECYYTNSEGYSISIYHNISDITLGHISENHYGFLTVDVKIHNDLITYRLHIRLLDLLGFVYNEIHKGKVNNNES